MPFPEKESNSPPNIVIEINRFPNQETCEAHTQIYRLTLDKQTKDLSCPEDLTNCKDISQAKETNFKLKIKITKSRYLYSYFFQYVSK